MPTRICGGKSKRRTLLGILSVLILFFTLSINIFGQAEKSDDTVRLSIPNQAMEQVVRRILVWYFKPKSQKKIVYLSENGIQKSWLPKIEGIEFQLLTETEIAEKQEVYFFAKLREISKNKFHIGFAFGDPNCSHRGDSWSFRVSEEKVRLWKKHRDGFFGFCRID